MTLLSVAAAYSLPQATATVQITEGILEDRPQFIIHTEPATWFYDRAGGGFSRLIDQRRCSHRGTMV